MKMIIRADDVGYTHVHNLGTFQSVDQGLVTSCDVMLDTPGSIEALQLLRDRPWISTGWHTHFWGSPVLPPSQVPSMYDASTGHFRADLSTAEDVSYEECLAEMRAQMELAVKYLGRALDTAMAPRGTSPFGRAMAKLIEEYGIVTGYAGMHGPASAHFPPAAPRWADRKIMMAFPTGKTHSGDVFFTDSIAVQQAYDPLRVWTDDEYGIWAMDQDAIPIIVFHPGYVDEYVAKLGDHGPNAWKFLTTRPVEVLALCSQALRDWMLEHQIELVNLRDALYH